MILGIGTDIADIKRIADVLEQHGGRFRERCFAEEEREAAVSSKDAAAFYARRWAAKEAAAKALGLGIRDNIFLKDIVVTNDDTGKPSLTLRGGAKDRLAAITPGGMTPRIHVSLADDPPAALAFVVISAEKQ
jgi:holo-[acyl-carrier protein] synthase